MRKEWYPPDHIDRIHAWFERLFGYCWGCDRWFTDLKRRRLNTAYYDEESNYMCSCGDCYQEAHDQYEDMWAEYNSGRY